MTHDRPGGDIDWLFSSPSRQQLHTWISPIHLLIPLSCIRLYPPDADTGRISAPRSAPRWLKIGLRSTLRRCGGRNELVSSIPAPPTAYLVIWQMPDDKEQKHLGPASCRDTSKACTACVCLNKHSNPNRSISGCLRSLLWRIARLESASGRTRSTSIPSGPSETGATSTRG